MYLQIKFKLKIKKTQKRLGFYKKKQEKKDITQEQKNYWIKFIAVCKKSTLIGLNHFKAFEKTIKFWSKKYVWKNITIKTKPIFYKTKKSKNIRMGKGKGTKVKNYVFPAHKKDKVFSFLFKEKKKKKKKIKITYKKYAYKELLKRSLKKLPKKIIILRKCLAQ